MAVPNFPANIAYTHNVDVGRDTFKFAVGAASAVGTLSQASGAFVTSVAKAATGRFTVTLSKPYPATLLKVEANLSASAVTANLFLCRYKEGSYDPAAGTFEIMVSKPTDDTHATTQVAADPENPSTISVELVYLKV